MFLPGNCDDCINRRFNFVSPLIALQFPVGTDQTMAGAIGAGKPAEAFVGKRGDRNFFVAGTVVQRADSGSVSVYPVSDCTVSVMVVGIHVAGPEITVFHNAVPVLPDSCSSLGDRIEPGRIVFPQQKRPGEGGIAVIGKHMEQIRRADKSGL